MGQFARGLRQSLFQEHFGLAPGCDALNDPVSDEGWAELTRIADSNTDIYERVFGCLPSDSARSWSDVSRRRARLAAAIAEEDDDDGEHGYENEQDDDNAAAAAPAAPESAEEMQEMMLEVFNAVDTDRSGTIEQAELADILESVPGLSVTPEVVQRIFDRLDTTGSGKLDFYEFAPLAFELLNREEEEDDDDNDNDNDDEYDSGADGDDVAVCVRDCDCDHCYCAVVCRTANVVARVGSKRASPRVYKLVGWLVALGRH